MNTAATLLLMSALLTAAPGEVIAGEDSSPTEGGAPVEFHQAVRALEAGEIERAIALLEPFRSGSRTPPQVTSLLGILYLDAGRPEDALEVLAPLAEREPPQPAALYHAGRAAVALGRNDLAEDYLRRSLQVEPDTPAARELGLLLGRLAQPLDAYLLLKPWAEKHPEDTDVRLAAALIALRLERLPEVEQLLSDLPQDNPKVRLLWGRLLLRRGEPYAAIATLRPLEGANGKIRLDAIGTLADAYLEVGESQDAVTLLRSAPGVDRSPMLALKLAQALYQGAELGEAIRVLTPHAETLLESDSTGPSTLDAGIAREYGRFLSAAGQHGEAIPYLHLATDLAPGVKQAWQALGQALAATGRIGEAEEALEQFQELSQAEGSVTLRQDRLRQEQQDPTGRELRRAGELLAVGETEQALTVLESEIALAPHDLRPRLMASQVHLREGNLERALEITQDAVGLRPENADAWYQLGAVHLAANDMESAEDQFRETLRLSPAHVPALNDLAVLLMVAGRYNEARELLHKVLEVRPDDPQAATNLEQLEAGQ